MKAPTTTKKPNSGARTTFQAPAARRSAPTAVSMIRFIA
jgi:hypothetical protein